MLTKEERMEKFKPLYEKNKKHIFAIALRYSGNDINLAEEFVQESFLKLYKNLDTVDEKAAIKWLTVVVKREAISYWRRTKKEFPGGMGSELYDKKIQPSAEDVYFEDMKHEKFRKMKDEIFGALYQKNERWYEAVTLVYGMDQKQQDAANQMGISIEVLHSVLYRARKWIKENFDL